MHKKGFTLIELLVVISIISLLSSVVLASLNAARVKSRDAVRVQNLRQIALALEFYYDKNGKYPRSIVWCTQISNPQNGWGASFQADLAEWLPDMPLDPIYAGTYQDYFYMHNSETSYSLYAELEGSDRAVDGINTCARIGNINNEYDYRIPPF